MLCSSHAAVLYSEDIDGDLSNFFFGPDILTVQNGSNEISGATSAGDLDLFTLIVPEGHEIVALNILNYDSTQNNVSFLGLQPGMTLSHSPIEIQNNDQIPINYLLFGEALGNLPGETVLSTLLVGQPLSGSDLTEGSYAFWLNETGAGADWTLEFVVVPEPSSYLLLLISLTSVLLRRQR